MSRPHSAARLALLCACLLLAPRAVCAARQTTTAPSESAARGIESYRAGDTKQAVKLLREAVKRDKNDFRAWLYLGLAYNAGGKSKDARKAAERASRLLETHFWEEYRQWHDEAGALPPDAREARRASMAGALSEVAAALESRSPRDPREEDFWAAQLEVLRFYERTAAAPRRTIYPAGELTKKAVITLKPEPTFTEEARAPNVSGRVRLRALLAADGTVGPVFVLDGLPDGLTRAAVSATRRIKFVPAEKDGRPVSQWVVLEYHFNVF